MAVAVRLLERAALGALLSALGSCSPLGGAGDSCEKAPCRTGFVCVDGVCAEPPPPPRPAPPCETAEDCPVDGDTSGRACNDGVCAFATCAFDLQCQNRICLGGVCGDAALCADDDQCLPAGICDGAFCRPACQGEDDCPSIGGAGLASCVEGRCQQRCLGDATCIGGGICEDGVCLEPFCGEDIDCDDDEDRPFACTQGRCVPFTPCNVDDDCFDANFYCDDTTAGGPDHIGRCRERPACRSDQACGPGSLCVDRHCRDATVCAVDSDCDAVEECVAARCVRSPLCRSDADCEAGSACDELRCRELPLETDPATVVVADDFGACGGGATSCNRVLFLGESIRVAFQGFDGAGLPVRSAVVPTNTSSATVAQDGSAFVVTAAVAGVGTVTWGETVLTVHVLPARGADALRVLVVDEGTGAALEGVAVLAGTDGEGVTNDDGLAIFAAAPSVGLEAAIAARNDNDAVAVILDGLAGDVRIALPGSESIEEAAALTMTIRTTGDETGPVGLGLALPSVEGPAAVTLSRMFGAFARGQIELPLLGSIPVLLPSSMSLEASLPLLGTQMVRPAAQGVVAPGPAFALCLEDRREQQDLLTIALAADPRGLALDLASDAETMDMVLAAAGSVAPQPFVPDALDSDGDGDTGELVPDFVAGATLVAAPSQSPSERVGVRVGPLPADAEPRALAVLGLDVPGRFVPVGVGVVVGATQSEPLKATAVDSALGTARRAIVVEALFADDGLSSQVVLRAAAFGPEMDSGGLLRPPAGAFVLPDTPAPGARLVVFPATPGATTLVATLLDGTGRRWRVVAPAGPGEGAVLLPAFIPVDTALVEAEALRLPGANARAASQAPFLPGSPSSLARVFLARARAR